MDEKPPSLTLPRKGGGNDNAGRQGTSSLPARDGNDDAVRESAPSPLTGEGRGGGEPLSAGIR